MASLVKWLFFSGAHAVDGTPVASGLAYFYQEGSTSVAVTVYADHAETTPLAQPVVLDAAGRAEVYCKSQAEIIIKTAAGASVRTTVNGTSVDADQADVTWGGTSSALSTALAAIETSIGASGKYLEGGTNSVARNVKTVLRQFISPYDFNATGDGVANDTVALQRAVDRAVATGLPLNLETGTYKTTMALTSLGAINIYGAGNTKAIIDITGTGFTGLTVVASNSYLRDFAIHVPYAGATYDVALAISGVGCAIERLEVTGGQGIISTAPFTKVKGCVVTFDCPNGSGAGYGIKVQDNSIVEGCKVTASAGSATHLTTGICLYSASSVSSSVAIGGKVTGAYVGGDGGIFFRTEFDTCVTGLKCTGPMHGGIGCRATSCTTGFLVSGGVYPVNIANHFDEVPFYDGALSFQTDATATPTFVLHAESDVHVFKCTYDGVVSNVTINLASDVEWKVGKKTRIIIQTTTDVDSVTDFTFGTDVVAIGDPTINSAQTMVTSEWIWTGTGELAQIEAWTTRSFITLF